MNGPQLCDQVFRYLRKHYALGVGWVAPPGLTLVMHPLTWYTLLQDEAVFRRVDPHKRTLMDIPVQLDGLAADFGWKLVVVTVEELLSGEIERISP